MARRPYIIAEAGINHNGEFKLAKKLVDEAVKAGADCVKFQTFVPEKLVSRYAEKADYQKAFTDENESQLSMLKKLELSYDDYRNLAKYAASQGIDFCTTAFDEESIRLVHELGCKFWKIPSGEITNYPYLVQVASYQEPIVMSTGMSNLDEVEEAVNIIGKYSSATLILLHCNTEYPTPFCDVNLLAMKRLQEKFQCLVGYSDHTPGIEIPSSETAIGAVIIEKHFTLDRNMPGPDHKASITPKELCELIEKVRNVETALGNGIKILQKSEEKNVDIARKSIVASCNIKKGDILSMENITTKRPGNGISPMRWNEVLGKKAIRDFKEDELIEI